jgi:pimeloyl-ACP methyl ester carboxylesterase
LQCATTHAVRSEYRCKNRPLQRPVEVICQIAGILVLPTDRKTGLLPMGNPPLGVLPIAVRQNSAARRPWRGVCTTDVVIQTHDFSPRSSGKSPPLKAKDLWHHRFARVEGVRLHWAELGDSTSRPPLVLLHGLKDCYRSWRQVTHQLARDRRVLIPDLPGHGLSDHPDASYELGWYAHIMARWLDAAGIDRADVVGHSFGGGIAQVMLLECPERIRRLVLVASGGLGREISLPLRLMSIPHVVEHLGQRLMGPCTRLALKAAGDVLSSEDLAWLSSMNAQSGSARAFARTIRGIIDWRGQRHTFFQHVDELSTLPPIAVFWGDRDTVVPFSHAEALARSVEGVRITRFEGCGHYPHHEKPDAFAAMLRDFLETSDMPAARLRRVSTRWADKPDRVPPLLGMLPHSFPRHV